MLDKVKDLLEIIKGLSNVYHRVNEYVDDEQWEIQTENILDNLSKQLVKEITELDWKSFGVKDANELLHILYAVSSVVIMDGEQISSLAVIHYDLIRKIQI